MTWYATCKFSLLLNRSTQIQSELQCKYIILPDANLFQGWFDLLALQEENPNWYRLAGTQYYPLPEKLYLSFPWVIYYLDTCVCVCDCVCVSIFGLQAVLNCFYLTTNQTWDLSAFNVQDLKKAAIRQLCPQMWNSTPGPRCLLQSFSHTYTHTHAHTVYFGGSPKCFHGHSNNPSAY